MNKAAVLIVDVSRRLCSKCETPVVNTALLSSLSTNSSDPFINETRRLRNVWYLRVRWLTSRFHCSFTQQLILQPMAGLKESQPSLPPRRRVTVLERYQNRGVIIMWFAWKIALRPTDLPGPAAAAAAVCHNDNLLNKVVVSLSGDTPLEDVLKI